MGHAKPAAEVKEPVRYRDHIISRYADEELVGGPYENNEERVYRRTGKFYLQIRKLRSRYADVTDLKTLQEAKQVIDLRLNKNKLANLASRREKLLTEIQSKENRVREIERQLTMAGIPFVRFPHRSGYFGVR